LADIGITQEELEEFTHQFNNILDYFDILDQVPEEENVRLLECNIFREDEVTPALPLQETIMNAPAEEEGFVRAPRVM
jgi:aspartyl-tRNA(Asn)/glutamyl-tRNA(Gln) amidotransferase subunit C